MVTASTIKIWKVPVGAMIWDEARQLAIFEFEPDFTNLELDIAPLTMPLGEIRSGHSLYSFHGLPKATYLGLPGILADSLPDVFGNSLLESWLARQGRDFRNINPVERLCYTGRRGMGALEFEPAYNPSGMETSSTVGISELLLLAGEALKNKKTIKATLVPEKAGMINDILKVGTSAGGARPKAILAINDNTGEVRSGQVRAPEGFGYWIIKFDGLTGGTPPLRGIMAGLNLPTTKWPLHVELR